MVCYSPLHGYESKGYTDKGKKYVVFNRNDGWSDRPMVVPCGNCIGCRLERSKQWAIRCVHEASLHEDNSFITLTFDEQNINNSGTLVKADFQKFIKRLRKKFSHKKIRYFHCGEYGTACRNCHKSKRYCECGNWSPGPGRPHHHACIFGLDFEDKEIWQVRDGVRLYRSATLEKLWPFGFCTVGDVTFESAAYVARYITKKVNGDMAENHYQRIDFETGEVVQIEPEYITMSRRPGIAAGWFDKFKDDVYPKDFVTMRGKKLKPPKFYDKLLDTYDTEVYHSIKNKRRCGAKFNLENNTAERLIVREQVQMHRLGHLKRGYEDDS